MSRTWLERLLQPQRDRNPTGLSSAFVWPASRELAEGLSWHRPPAPLTPGRSVLVSVRDDEPIGQLWELRPNRPTMGTRPFVDTALDAIDDAHRAVLATLPLLPRPRHLAVRGYDWSAAPLCSTAQKISTLDRTSFGLGMSLAWASRLLDIPLPAHLAGLAAVGPDHTLSRVLGIEKKLQAIVGNALGVTRVIVAEEQPEDVEGVIATLAPADGPRRLEVVRLKHIRDVWPLVFDTVRVADHLWPTPAEADQAVVAWFNRCLRSPEPLIDHWTPVLRTLQTLRERPRSARLDPLLDFSLARVQAHLAVAVPPPVTAAHLALAGHSDVSIPSHEYQQQLDNGDPLPAEVERSILDQWSRSPQDAALLEQLGALGRWLARDGRFEEADRLLRETVRAWFLRDEPARASQPLCELLRVSAMLRAEDTELDELTEEFERTRGRSTPAGDVYLEWALLRRSVLVGEPLPGLTRAVRWLASCYGSGSPWVAMHRWRIAALRALGQAPEAAESLTLLDRTPVVEATGMLDISVPLAHLDGLLASETPDEAAVAHWLETTLDCEPNPATTCAGEGTPVERARRLVRLYPY